jgi:hypothetical protein
VVVMVRARPQARASKVLLAPAAVAIDEDVAVHRQSLG